MEDGVLNKIEREQRRPSGVQRLEDDLRVVARLERDRDDFQQIAERDPKRPDPLVVIAPVAELGEPAVDRAAEEGIGLIDPVARIVFDTPPLMPQRIAATAAIR